MTVNCVVFLLAFRSAFSNEADMVPKDLHFDKSLLEELVSQNLKLTEKLTQLEADVNFLKGSQTAQENTIKDQAKTIKSLKQSLDNFCKLIPLNSTRVRLEGTEQADTVAEKEEIPQLFTGSHPFAVHRKRSLNRNRRQESEHVAFSAYVDYEVLHMGKDQTVQFQNVLLNDGNGYNKHTGIFAVPRDGVYLLTFFVEDYHRFQSIFHMVVDRNIVTSAIADPLPEGQNVQGGNVIIIRLKAGNSVWVTTGTAGDNIEGYGALRTSTFSGYLLYQ